MAQATNTISNINEKKIGQQTFLVMDIDKATSRDHKDGKDMDTKIKSKTLSIDVDPSTLTPEDVQLLAKYKLPIYTPKPTEDNPTPSPFVLIKFAGTVTTYELDGMRKERVNFDDKMPNFGIRKATLAITRTKNDNKGQSDYTRISSLRFKASNFESYFTDFFGDDDAFTQVDTKTSEPVEAPKDVTNVEAIEAN